MKGKFFKNPAFVDMEFYKIIRKALRKGYALKFDENFFDLLAKTNARFAKILKENSTSGLCYGFALLLATNIPNCTLVHGVLEKLPCISENEGSYYEFEHAWVEKGNMVFDTSAKCVFDKEKYYEMFGAKTKQTYTKSQLSDEATLKSLCSHVLWLRPEMSEIIYSFEPFSNFDKEKLSKSNNNLQMQI